MTSADNTDEMVPLPGAPDILADPETAQILQGRLVRGEVTADDLRAILAGQHNPPA